MSIVYQGNNGIKDHCLVLSFLKVLLLIKITEPKQDVILLGKTSCEFSNLLTENNLH